VTAGTPHAPHRSYPVAARIAHWAMLLLCIGQFPTSLAIHRTHSRHPLGIPPSDIDLFLHQLHAWSGWAIGGLALLLFVYRLTGGAPPFPSGMRPWQRLAARAGHLLLYGCLAALVVTGTATMYLTRALAPAHNILTRVGIGLVLIHAAAALWHELVRRDGALLALFREPEKVELRETHSSATRPSPTARSARLSQVKPHSSITQ